MALTKDDLQAIGSVIDERVPAIIEQKVRPLVKDTYVNRDEFEEKYTELQSEVDDLRQELNDLKQRLASA